MPFATDMFEPDPWTYEYMAWKGMIHFAAFHQMMVPGIPFDMTYSMTVDTYWISSRHPIYLSAWQNVLHIFQSSVWLCLVISLLAISLTFILPAIHSTDPLPANPDGVAQLTAQIDAVAHPAPLASPPTLPQTAYDISGNIYVFED